MVEFKKNKAPALPPDVQAKIGEKLKAIYDDVVRQPVPDRFRDLLSQLDAANIPGGGLSAPASQARVEAEGSGK